MSKELKLRLSSSIQQKLKDAIESNSPPPDITSLCNEIYISNELCLPDAVKLLHWIQQNTNEMYSFNLLENSYLVLPSIPVTPRNKELEKRIKLLKRKQENIEYNKMVENINRKHEEKPTNTYKTPMISGLNFAVSFIAATFATSFVLRSIIPSLAIRLSIGVVVGSLLLTIEIILALRAIADD